MNPLARYLKPKYLKPVFFLFLVLYLFSLWGRIPFIDDGWIAEYVYYLEKDGYAHSELMRGINKQEVRFIAHHKLFSLHGVLFLKLFGFSLYTFKSVSLLYFIIFIALFSVYTRRWRKLFNKEDLWFALILTIAWHDAFKFSFIFRPEIMMMTCGFAGYILLEKYLTSPKRQILFLFFSGIFFGFTMVMHLHGIILVTAGFILLLWNRRFIAVFGYGAGVLLAFSLYFFDFHSFSDFALWRHQVFDCPIYKRHLIEPLWLNPAVNILKEHLRYFYNPGVFSLTVLFFVTLILGFKFLYRSQPNLVRFCLLVAILTSLITISKSRFYLLLNIPYFILIITLTIKALKENRISSWLVKSEKTNVMVQYVLLVLFAGFIIVSAVYDIKLAIKKFSPDDSRSLARKYTKGNTDSMNVIAPTSFVFNEIENFNRIQGDVCYKYLQKLDTTIKGEGFFSKALFYEIDLMLISKQFQKGLGVSGYKTGDSIGYYEVIDKTDELLVFKRINVHQWKNFPHTY